MQEINAKIAKNRVNFVKLGEKLYICPLFKSTYQNKAKIKEYKLYYCLTKIINL